MASLEESCSFLNSCDIFATLTQELGLMASTGFLLKGFSIYVSIMGGGL